MEWISVNEEKPKDNEVVLVFDKWEDRFYVEVAEYNEIFNAFDKQRSNYCFRVHGY